MPRRRLTQEELRVVESDDDEDVLRVGQRLAQAQNYILYNDVSQDIQDKKTKELVRYCLFMTSSNTPIRRKDVNEKGSRIEMEME